MNIYFLPTSEYGMNDRILRDENPYNGGMWNLPYFNGLANALKKLGYEVHTVDFWSAEKSKADDILVVQDHPGESFLFRVFYHIKYFSKGGGFRLIRRKFLYENYKKFGRRVLINSESPMITPYVYSHLNKIKKTGMYQKIMLGSRGWGEGVDYFNLYYYRNKDITSPYFHNEKDLFLVLINGNQRPHSLKNELYGERLKAIKYWSSVPGFDLYGRNWGKIPRHPLFMHYKKYVNRVWRGEVDDKLRVLSRYKFAICYENSSYDSYVSEKIFDCLSAGVIPIYLGAPDIETIIPANCFIDFRKFSGYSGLHKYIESLSADDIGRYRRNILSFLSDSSTMKGMESLAGEVLGLS